MIPTLLIGMRRISGVFFFGFSGNEHRNIRVHVWDGICCFSRYIELCKLLTILRYTYVIRLGIGDYKKLKDSNMHFQDCSDSCD